MKRKGNTVNAANSAKIGKAACLLSFAALLGCTDSTDSSSEELDDGDAEVASLFSRLELDLSDADALALIDDIGDETVTLSRTDIEDLDRAITPIADATFSSTPLTPFSNVPTSGTANFIGGLELVPDGNANERVFGALTVDVNFATNAIDGLGRNFYHRASGTAQTGTLDLDGQIQRNANLAQSNGISATLTGSLDGPNIDGEIDALLGLDFADNATVIYGSGAGTIDGTPGLQTRVFVLEE